MLVADPVPTDDPLLPAALTDVLVAAPVFEVALLLPRVVDPVLIEELLLPDTATDVLVVEAAFVDILLLVRAVDWVLTEELLLPDATTDVLAVEAVTADALLLDLVVDTPLAVGEVLAEALPLPVLVTLTVGEVEVDLEVRDDEVVQAGVVVYNVVTGKHEHALDTLADGLFCRLNIPSRLCSSCICGVMTSRLTGTNVMIGRLIEVLCPFSQSEEDGLRRGLRCGS